MSAFPSWARRCTWGTTLCICCDAASSGLDDAGGASGNTQAQHPPDRWPSVSPAGMRSSASSARMARVPWWPCAAHATGAKQFSVDWWRRMIASLHSRLPSARVIEIRPPNGVAALPELPAYYSRRVRQVAAVLEAADCFVCADSGLMHLGAATDATTVGLFKVTEPRLYMPRRGASCALTGERRCAGAGRRAGRAAAVTPRFPTGRQAVRRDPRSAPRGSRLRPARGPARDRGRASAAPPTGRCRISVPRAPGSRVILPTPCSSRSGGATRDFRRRVKRNTVSSALRVP